LHHALDLTIPDNILFHGVTTPSKAPHVADLPDLS